MRSSTLVHGAAALVLCACPLPFVVGDSPLDGSSGAGESSGGAASAEPTTSGAQSTSAGETTAAGETTGSVGSSTGAVGTSGDSTGAASTGGVGGSTGGDDTLEIDPRTMTFFALPIDSLRYAAAGHDAERGLCVSIIWFDPPPGQHCDVGPMQLSPYVWIEPGSPPCTGWDYGPNVEIVGASGCYEWVSFEPPVAALDLTLEVVGEPFTGTITIDTR